MSNLPSSRVVFVVRWIEDGYHPLAAYSCDLREAERFARHVGGKLSRVRYPRAWSVLPFRPIANAMNTFR